jgi:release factor glutamine methyltransferase
VTATVAEAIRAGAERLAAVGDTARLDAELLMAEALGTTRSGMLVRRMRDPAPGGFDGLIERRERGEPVAYITGRQEFWGLEFGVTPNVLIPRADSETVVRAALEAKPDARRVLDLGTGSGALLLAMLSELPEVQGVGIDASAAALVVAAANAERLGLAARARMLHLDWTRPGWTAGLGRFDLILANPPYVEDDAELAPDVRDHEPHLALFAGPEGLEAYRSIIPQLPDLLADEGAAVLEIGPTQAEAVTAIAAAFGLAAALHRDLACRPRALELKKALGKPPPAHYLEAKPAGG